MPQCPKCGKETPQGKFCQYCGSPLESGEGAASQPAGTQPGFPPAPPPSPGGFAPPAAAPPRTAPAPGGAPYRPGRQAGGSAPAVFVFGGIGVLAMIISIVGSIMPWISLYGASLSGWEKDGKITLFLALITLAFFVVGLITRARWPFIVGLLGSLVVGVVFVVDLVDVLRQISSAVGAGLYVGVVGAVIGLVAGVGGTAVSRD